MENKRTNKLSQDMNLKLTQLIGELKELFHQLKTKDNVDHAGHSQLQEPQKDYTLLKLDNQKNSQNKLQLIAHIMEIKDVMED